VFLCWRTELSGKKHNSLGLTDQLDSNIRNHGRPFQVLFANRFAEAIKRTIQSAELQKLDPVIGSVSQFTDSTSVFDEVKLYDKLKNLYR
jgi:hypothetical protein